METLDEDLKDFSHAMNITEMNLEVRRNVKSNISSSSPDLGMYFKDLPATLLVAIREIYLYDFILYDYPMPEYLVNAQINL